MATGFGSTPPLQRPLVTNEFIRDYTHASKIFRSNFYQNAPKFKYLFHTYFKINSAAMEFFNGGRSGTTVLPTSDYGVLVKDIKLPTFSFNTTQLNQYNRKRIVQTKIKYDPVDVSFHDDNGDTINGMWQAYYQYYYQDGLNANAQFNGARGGNAGAVNYNSRNIYQASITGDNNWGYNGAYSNGTNIKVPFFDSITVFGFNQHNFTAYTFINPMITQFSHDNYNYSEAAGTMTNKMTFDYETVTYDYGHLDGQNPSNLVPGFGEPAVYDTRTSPITPAGTNSQVLGQGSLVDSAGGALTQGVANLPQFTQNSQTVAYGTQLRPIPTASGAINAMGYNAQQNIPTTRNTLFSLPAAGAAPGSLGPANFPVIGGATSPTVITQEPTVGQQYNGGNLVPGYSGINSNDILPSLPPTPTIPQ